MSEDVLDKKQIKLPQPPMSPGTQTYYFIYGEWIQVVQPSSVITADNPTPTDMPFVRTIGLNECIDVPPAVFLIMAQQERPSYTIKWAMGISKELYMWYKQVEKIYNRAADELDSANRNGDRK